MQKPSKEDLAFGRHFTDHMLKIDWSSDLGWSAAEIIPQGPIEVSPAIQALNYGTSVNDPVFSVLRE